MAQTTGDPSTREKILQAVLECASTQKVFSRARIQAMTGLKYPVVDDHLERLRDDGKLVKVLSGTYELVRTYPAFERISYTPLLDEGIMILEQGDTVIKMGFPALRLHVLMLAGFLEQHYRSEAQDELRITVGRVENDLRQLKSAHTQAQKSKPLQQPCTCGDEALPPTPEHHVADTAPTVQ